MPDLKRIAEETVASLKSGHYTTPSGSDVDFMPLLQRCIDGTRCYRPEALTGRRSNLRRRGARDQVGR